MRIQQLLVFLESVLLQPTALIHLGHHAAHFRHIIRTRRALDKIARAKHRILKTLLSHRFAHVLEQLRVGVGQHLHIQARFDVTPADALVVFQAVLRILILLE